jgi:hypothetical protein
MINVETSKAKNIVVFMDKLLWGILLVKNIINLICCAELLQCSTIKYCS